ncbi:hypothetical protein GCM10007320_54370 [Pseudorhodoferax aquiterrae]|uniref:C2H2-type domain-containing protein n=1 Tax=Pseudorhodoferax aquiterrae TaxID=747304 RepID=A0ABQ3GB85_9BURK|nr:hypothetical protein GCM10007320_54370 [Pseudorhodoferax aquiterrae]
MGCAKHDAVPVAFVKEGEIAQDKADASVSDVQGSTEQLSRSLLNVRLAAFDLDSEMRGTHCSGSAHCAAIFAKAFDRDRMHGEHVVHSRSHATRRWADQLVPMGSD